MTLSYRHFERKREIFVICGQAVDVWKSRTGNLLSAYIRASLHIYSAALLIFMRRTNPVEPVEPVEPSKPLSPVIKGRPAPRANPEP